MGLNNSLSLFFFLTILLSLSTVVKADNVTRAFEKHTNFSIMSDLLIKTNLTALISQYRTITILAVRNDAISSITGKADVELKNILMNHVILDYYDELKLKNLREMSFMITTLYQTTGLGDQMNGFINCTKSKGKIFFGSEVKGSPLVARYVLTLYHNPFNLSIIHISMPIVAPGLSVAVFPPPPPPRHLASSPSLSPSPSPSPFPSLSPSPSPTDDDAMAPSPSPGNADGPADEGDASGSDTTPTTETPEADSSAPAPSADYEKMEAADKAGPSSSACKVGLSIGVVLFQAFLERFAGF